MFSYYKRYDPTYYFNCTANLTLTNTTSHDLRYPFYRYYSN